MKETTNHARNVTLFDVFSHFTGDLRHVPLSRVGYRWIISDLGHYHFRCYEYVEQKFYRKTVPQDGLMTICGSF